MGKYDDISHDEIRRSLLEFARGVLRLEEDEKLLTSSPGLLRALGELRQMLFAYEVRSTRWLAPRKRTRRKRRVSTQEAESLRVVQEAIKRQSELYRHLDGRDEIDL